MKIVIVSDTHRDLTKIQEVLRTEKADLYLHAGDSCLSANEIYPFMSVRGNCDYFPYTAFVSKYTPIGKIVVKHYPFTLEEINTFAERGYSIFVFGHTHKKLSYKTDSYYVFNPGSLTIPRDGDEGSYLVLNIENNKLTFEFKNI